MTLQTNSGIYNILIYGANPDQPTFAVHKFALSRHGSYAVQGATGPAPDGTYRGYMTACVYDNQWGDTLGPSLVAGQLSFTITRNDKETPLSLGDFTQPVNFLSGYDFYFFKVHAGDPLPSDANLFFKGRVMPGDFKMVADGYGGIDSITIRILDRIKFDDKQLLRQPYLFQTESERWAGQMKPCIFGNWSPSFNPIGGTPPPEELYWIEAPVIDKENREEPICGFKYFTADMGARSDDATDSRRAAAGPTPWGDDTCVNQDDAGEFLQIYEDGWRRYESAGWAPVDAIDDVLCNQIAGPVQNCRLSTLDGGWDHITADETGTCGQYSSMAISSVGSIHIASWNETKNRLQYATNHTTGQVWRTYTPDNDGTRGEHCSLALDADDAVHISYVGIDENNDYALFYATNASGEWVVETVISQAAAEYQYTSIGIDSGGKAHISYYDSNTSSLNYATNDTGAWVAEIADNAAAVGKYTSLAIDSADNIHISYYDQTNTSLKYATGTAGLWVLTTVDLLGTTGLWTSIVLDSGDNPHISYYNSTDTKLRYTVLSGGVWGVIDLDVAGDVGQYSSMAMGGDGFCRISYYDATNKNLKYATRETMAWVISTVDSDKECGEWTSIALTDSDQPYISYYVARSTEGAWRYLQIVNTPDTEWQTGQTAMLRAPRGFPEYGEGADGDTATHPVDIIYLLLRDTQIGLSVAAVDIDYLVSFAAVKAAMGDVTARNYYTQDRTVLQVISELCEEFQLKIVVESGLYKLILLNWTTTPAPADTIVGGQIEAWRFSSDHDQRSMTDFNVKYKLNPANGIFTLTYTSAPVWESGMEPRTFESHWIYEPATMGLVGGRMIGLYGGIIRNLTLECDFSCEDFSLGDRVTVATDPDDEDSDVSGIYQITGYVKDFVTASFRLDLISTSTPIT